MQENKLSISEVLNKMYDHSFEMVKFGETKNTTLIAFNGAIIIGLSTLIKDVSFTYLKYYLIYVISMCGVSIFISFSSLIAKIMNKPHQISLKRTDNPLFFGTIALLSDDELLSRITRHYDVQQENAGYETDLARQIIVTSQIAARKFKLFNVAISIMFCGLLTPLSWFIYYIFLSYEK